MLLYGYNTDGAEKTRARLYDNKTMDERMKKTKSTPISDYNRSDTTPTMVELF